MAPTLEKAAALPLVQDEVRRASQILGYTPHLETAPGGTDATFMIHEARIPTMVELGPAGGLSHDVHEFVELDSVVDGAKILALMAIDQLGVAD
jgi:acetylornithine deacetylase/succinyl-diaminopimelate desuccinylase-like protein